MEKILEDFPCWKAKFTVSLNIKLKKALEQKDNFNFVLLKPFGLCFAVIPTSQSIYNPYQFKNNQINNPKSFTRDLNERYIFTFRFSIFVKSINNCVNLSIIS